MLLQRLLRLNQNSKVAFFINGNYTNELVMNNGVLYPYIKGQGSNSPLSESKRNKGVGG